MSQTLATNLSTDALCLGEALRAKGLRRGLSFGSVAGMDPWAVTPATDQDLPALAAIRDEAARWQVRRGIRQWNPGEVPIEEFHRQLHAGQLFVVRSTGEPIAAVRLLWSDPLMWDLDPTDAAGYVHGLMTKRRGTGLGGWLLAWAETQIAAAGRRLARLDCVATNRRLRRYYTDQGYHEAGRRSFPNPAWRPVMRFEKHLAVTDLPRLQDAPVHRDEDAHGESTDPRRLVNESVHEPASLPQARVVQNGRDAGAVQGPGTRSTSFGDLLRQRVKAEAGLLDVRECSVEVGGIVLTTHVDPLPTGKAQSFSDHSVADPPAAAILVNDHGDEVRL